MSRPGAKAGHSVFDEFAKQTPLIRRVLQRHRVPAVHVEDLVQETLLLAWEKLRRSELPQPLSEAFIRGWLTRTAEFKARNFWRTARGRAWEVPEKHGTDVADDAPGAEERLCDREKLAALLNRLKPKHREVLLLDAQGYSDKEIGAQIGIRAHAVTSRLHVARRQVIRSQHRSS